MPLNQPLTLELSQTSPAPIAGTSSRGVRVFSGPPWAPGAFLGLIADLGSSNAAVNPVKAALQVALTNVECWALGGLLRAFGQDYNKHWDVTWPLDCTFNVAAHAGIGLFPGGAARKITVFAPQPGPPPSVRVEIDGNGDADSGKMVLLLSDDEAAAIGGMLLAFANY